jgi:DNA-directed RNA polymerase specialized sigma subunit
MIDIHTDPDDSGHDSNFILHETTPNNLTQYRWRHPVLSPGDVADLLRATKGPEPAAAAAKDTLFKAYHRLVLKEAKPHCVAYGDSCDRRNDDLIAAGNFGLAEAIDRFNLNRNNGFTAYALPYIRKRLKETSKSFNRNGWAGETRLQRAVYGNHDLTTEQASKVMGRLVDEGEIEQAKTEVLGMCSEPVPYDTREPGYEDDDEERKPGVIALAPPCPRQRIFNATLEQRHGSLNELAEDADRRAWQRLKEIGRRAYALELVERDRARIAARAEPTQYLYGAGVTNPFGHILSRVSPQSSCAPKSRTRKKRPRDFGHAVVMNPPLLRLNTGHLQ